MIAQEIGQGKRSLEEIIFKMNRASPIFILAGHTGDLRSCIFKSKCSGHVRWMHSTLCAQLAIRASAKQGLGAQDSESLAKLCSCDYLCDLATQC